MCQRPLVPRDSAVSKTDKNPVPTEFALWRGGALGTNG